MENYFIDFDLLGFPEQKMDDLSPKGKGEAAVLIISYFQQENKTEDQSFMENVLKAALLTPLEEKVFHLQLTEANASLPIALIARQLKVKNILVFGIKPENLGIRAQLNPYQWVAIGDFKIIWCHPISTIREERQVKNNQKAAALWQALKAAFIKE